MVFLETKQLGWFALVKTFIAKLPEKIKKSGEHLLAKIKYIINGTLAWTRKYGKFQVHQSEMTFVNSLLNIIRSYTSTYEP
jgi:dynein heavy chain